MVNQFNGIKPGQARSSGRVGAGQIPDSRVAAKAADIKAFGDLIREKKRLNERNNEQAASLSTVDQYQPAQAVSIPFTDTCPGMFHRLHQITDDTPQGFLTRGGHEPALSLSLNTEGAESPMGTMPPKIIQSVVSVVHRMIMNHEVTGDPKKWDIQLRIDGLQLVEMSLVYEGENEWRLEFFDDQSPQQNGQDNAGLPSLYESMDDVLPDLEAMLHQSRPQLRLSAAVIERSRA